MLKKLFIYIFCLFALAPAASAVSFSRRTDLVDLKIIPEYKALSSTTHSMDIIAEINVKNDWHLYWDNPGDTGAPTTLSFYESPHYRLTSSIHTAPYKSVFENIITSYIYPQKLYFKMTFSLNDIAKLERLPFNLTLSYTACKDSCLPEEIKLNYALPIAKNAEKNPTYAAAVFAAKDTFPAKLTATVSFTNTHLDLEFENPILPNCAEPEFVSSYPKKSPLADLPTTTVEEQNRLQVEFNDAELPPDSKGILLCPGFAYYLEPQAIEHNPLTAQNTNQPQKTPDQPLKWLLLAFIAGLILNLMPCVLPILGLKALSLIQHAKQKNIVPAISYLAGVISSFTILAAILFYLRHIGTELGWGFQLQSPAFNIFLLLLFFLIFLNLTDKFPLPAIYSDKLSRLSDGKSFLTGFFAVIVACPCTGPFMGAALGYALSQPPAVYFGIFLSLGLGYALPYTLIEMFPHFFLKWLPKPGHWMLTLKKLLALPILLTCFWLAWVIYNQLSPKESTTTLTWQPYTPAAVNQAVAQKQAVFINFTAKWCLVCLLNDKTTLSSQTFAELVKKYKIRLFKADWTTRSEEIGRALKNYGRNSIPLYIYYRPQTDTPQILPQILTPEIVRQTILSNN